MYGCAGNNRIGKANVQGRSFGSFHPLYASTASAWCRVISAYAPGLRRSSRDTWQ